ncbi:AAA family ATPase [Rhodoblastus sp.]|uniref:AAA family ATPase n=1 Tax=Rhodoblastus sp. TaxID=1962975 RepID=UPI003F9D9922
MPVSPEDRLAALGVREMPQAAPAPHDAPRNGGGKGVDSGPRPFAPIEGEDNGAARFKPEDWNDVTFNPNEEWRAEDVLPMRGFGLIYGQKRSFKSFVAMHLALMIAKGEPWAGKHVKQGIVIYIAAEGAAGMRKRITAYMKTHEVARGQFILISVAPELGTRPGDLPALISAIEGAGLKPALIVVDTASKAISAADENGTGMAAFAFNAGRLVEWFDCLVLAIHHVGHDDAKARRPRGWSGLAGAVDVQILCERPGDEMRATLTMQKLKDEQDGFCFEVRLERVVVGHVTRAGAAPTDFAKEVSTLVVSDVVPIDAPAEAVAEDAKPQREQSQAAVLRDAFLETYDRLADAATDTSWKGYAGVRKVKVEAIEAALLDAGRLEKADVSNLVSSGSSRPSRRAQTAVFKARQFLLDKKTLIEGKGLIWRAK